MDYLAVTGNKSNRWALPQASYRQQEVKGKTIEHKKGIEQLGSVKSIGSALETRQSHTIENRVRNIVPKGH